MIGAITVLLTISILLFMVRSEWVYRKQAEFINDWGFDSYDALPSYTVMLLKFWVWDIYKFIKD